MYLDINSNDANDKTKLKHWTLLNTNRIPS